MGHNPVGCLHDLSKVSATVLAAELRPFSTHAVWAPLSPAASNTSHIRCIWMALASMSSCRLVFCAGPHCRNPPGGSAERGALDSRTRGFPLGKEKKTQPTRRRCGNLTDCDTPTTACLFRPTTCILIGPRRNLEKTDGWALWRFRLNADPDHFGRGPRGRVPPFPSSSSPSWPNDVCGGLVLKRR